MAKDTTNKSLKIVRRCTIDLADAASAEVDRIQSMFDLSVADVFRYALKLMIQYSNAVSAGRQFVIVDPSNADSRETLTLPLFRKIPESDRREHPPSGDNRRSE